MQESALIEANTRLLNELQDWLGNPGPEDHDRGQAITFYFRRYDQLAFPGGLERGLKLLAADDPVAVESAVTFLEVNPMFHRSGYVKADLLRFLKRASLSKTQRSRLRAVVLARVADRDSREFRHYTRLAAHLDHPELSAALHKLQKSPDPRTARHATWVLQAIHHATRFSAPRV